MSTSEISSQVMSALRNSFHGVAAKAGKSIDESVFEVSNFETGPNVVSRIAFQTAANREGYSLLIDQALTPNEARKPFVGLGDLTLYEVYVHLYHDRTLEPILTSSFRQSRQDEGNSANSDALVDGFEKMLIIWLDGYCRAEAE